MYNFSLNYILQLIKILFHFVLEKQSNQILLNVFTETNSKENIVLNTTEEISENGLSNRRVDDKISHNS